MSRVYVFADESGNFDFSRKPGASRYFSVGTVVQRDDGPGRLAADLNQLRHDLAWQGIGLDGAFHATEDTQQVRDAVFKTLAVHPLRVDVTLVEKSKAIPRIRDTDVTFFKYAWFYHFRALAPQIIDVGDELMVVASEIGTKKRRAAFRAAVEDVVRQCSDFRVPHRIAFRPCMSDPSLQAADYCLWAVTRYWERADDRSRLLVDHQVASQYDLFETGVHHYY
ncbi:MULTISPECIES: DUF3800 domain-containing protein [unclassified Frankia]|uniref:DUF3800 domain-containing protein n=1 Tax=unclassified Frankia TaxID=2632575 RepID=UPI002AD4CEE6|nr:MULTISPECIES: DUF3800 domain-containing protein [unclassified Frankia]